MTRLDQVPGKVRTIRTLIDAGLLAPTRPDLVIAAARAMRRFGRNAAAAGMVSALRYPDATALIDERDSLTFGQLESTTNALARAFTRQGVDHRTTVGLLCRNHIGFVQAAIATAKVGARALCLNTDFAGPQLGEVLAHESVTVLVSDDEFDERVDGTAWEGLRLVAWSDSGQGKTIQTLIHGSATSPVPPPAEHGRITILTSGTTGRPKGAMRGGVSLSPLAALLERVPLHARGTTVLPAPLFHAWGFAHFTLATALSSTLVLSRQFDAEATFGAIERHRADTLALVPIMLARMLDLDPATRARYDHSSLRAIVLGGSQLGSALAQRGLATFGDTLYNVYGSTEVAIASIATPADLRAAPSCVGRPSRGISLRLLDDDGQPVPDGTVGRIFVGSEMVFEGYTGGGSKDTVDGRAATGDVGHLDTQGRLYVDGRDDEMIVSGGENVFPAEVEDLLAGHPDIAEVAVVGVPDDDFGHRLAAYVVARPGASLKVSDVKDQVRSSLARFKVPRDVVFLETLPRNPAGKVLKRSLG